MCLVILKYGSWSIACGIKHGIFLSPKINGNVEEKLGAAWIVGKPICPMLWLLLNPKIPLTWLNVVSLASLRWFGYNWSIYSVSLNINVFSGSKPKLIMSFALSSAYLTESSHFNSALNKNFSSSVNCTTRGTLKASCSHLVKIKGIRCPMCSVEDEGPRPVYR